MRCHIRWVIWNVLGKIQKLFIQMKWIRWTITSNITVQRTHMSCIREFYNRTLEQNLRKAKTW